MTKANILDLLIEKKESELQAAQANYSQVTEERNTKYFEIIQNYFGGEFTLDDVSIAKNSYGTSYEVKRPHKEYNYDRELFTIRVNDSWSTSEFKDVTTSVYSTSDSSNWELERLVTVGEAARVILDFQEDIIANFNKVKDDFKEEFDVVSMAKYKIEKEIADLKSKKNNSFLEIAKKLLNEEGIEFTDKKGSIDIRWDWTIRGIDKAKIVRTTSSGKSADIEITSYGNTRLYEKVRMSNIEALQWQYRDYVLNPK